MFLSAAFSAYSMEYIAERRKLDCTSPKGLKKVHYGTFRYDETNSSPVETREPQVVSPVNFSTQNDPLDYNVDFATVFLIEIVASIALDKTKENS